MKEIKVIVEKIIQKLKLYIKPFNLKNINKWVDSFVRVDENYNNEIGIENRVKSQILKKGKNKENSNESTQFSSNYISTKNLENFDYIETDEEYYDLADEIYDDLFLSANYGDLSNEEINKFLTELIIYFDVELNKE